MATTITLRARLPVRRARQRPRQATAAVPEPRPERATRDRVARQLALANLLDRLVGEGQIASYADAARALGLTRARLSQVMARSNRLTMSAHSSLLSHSWNRTQHPA